MKSFLCFLALCMVPNFSLAKDLDLGLRFVPKNNSFLPSSLNVPSFSGKTVYFGKNEDIVTDDLDGLAAKNLYIVSLPQGVNAKERLSKVSKVHVYRDNDFAVVESIPGLEKDLAEQAHDLVNFCGGLLKLGSWGELTGETSFLASPVHAIETNLDAVKEMQSDIQAQKIYEEILKLEALGTRFHSSTTGKRVPEYLKTVYEELVPEGRSDVSIIFDDVARSPQDNIIVRIEGSESPDEIVILGSHIDSIAGRRGSNSAPGADDNASGTATNIEIFRVMMERNIVPKRTVEIHGYAAEEVGLVGSADLANDYRKAEKNVISMVQMDMNLYSGRRQDLSTVYFVKNDTNSELTGNLMTLAESYLGVKTLAASMSGGTSDHRSWNQRGYAVAFPFENPKEYNYNIHTVRDMASIVGNADFSALYAKMGLSYILHYAGF